MNNDDMKLKDKIVFDVHPKLSEDFSTKNLLDITEIPKPILFFLSEENVKNCRLGAFSIETHWFLEVMPISDPCLCPAKAGLTKFIWV